MVFCEVRAFTKQEWNLQTLRENTGGEEMKLLNVAVVSSCIIKNNTNANESCKQYFKLLIGEDKPDELVMMVKKYVLTDRTDLYHRFQIMRTFRGKTLYVQIFSIRVSTLQKAHKQLTNNWCK